MKLLLLLGLLFFAHEALAHLTSSHFPGYGFKWYSLVCGNACHDAIASATLSCTSMDHSSGHSGMSMTTTPDCYASDSAFLTTLALCMNTTCDPRELSRHGEGRSFGILKQLAIRPSRPSGTIQERLKRYKEGRLPNSTLRPRTP